MSLAHADRPEHQQWKEQLYITLLKSADVNGREADNISQTPKQVFALGVNNAETGQGSHDPPAKSPAGECER